MNASQLMNQNVDSIFQKGAPAPAKGTAMNPAVIDKKSKFQGPKETDSNPNPLLEKQPGPAPDVATASGVKVK